MIGIQGPIQGSRYYCAGPEGRRLLLPVTQCRSHGGVCKRRGGAGDLYAALIWLGFDEITVSRLLIMHPRLRLDSPQRLQKINHPFGLCEAQGLMHGVASLVV